MIRHFWIRKPLGLPFLIFSIALLLPVSFATAQTTLVHTVDDIHYRNGLELLDREKYVAAQKAFQDYIALNKNDLKTIDAKYYVAISALNLSNADADARIEQFIEEYPTHPKALLAYYELGNFYFKQKKYDKAIEYFKKADPDKLNEEQRVEAQFKLAYAYFSKQKFAEAGEIFNKLKRSQNKYTGAASYYSGYIAFRDGKYNEALVDLKKAAMNEEYKPLVPYMIINVYYKQQKYDELIKYAEEIKNDKNIRSREDIALLVGEAYYRKGNYAKAAEYLKEYASASRAKPAGDILYRLAYSQYKTDDFTGAITNFKPVASSRDTLSQYADYYLGLSYLQSGNKNFAINAFDEARKGKFSPEIREEASFYHAKVNYDAGNNSEAVLSLKDFIKAYPDSKHETEANELLSEAYLNSNNYAEAIAHLENVKRRSPRINTAYQRLTYNRGVELFNSEKFDEAITYFQKSLQTSSDPALEVAARFWMGEAYSVQRQYQEAINQYAVVFRAPRTAGGVDYQLKSRYGIGYAYYNTQQYDKAQTHFKEYVNQVQQAENKRNYDDALLRLADTYYVGKNYNEALRLYDQAINQNNAEKDYAYFQKGVILSITNRAEEARSNFNTLTSQYPNSRYIDNGLFQKAQLDFDNAAYAAAIAGFSRVIEQKPNSPLVPYALLRRALANSNIQNYNAAITDYQQIINRYPTHKTANSALIGLQESLASAGRGEEFNAYLAKYKQVNPGDNAVESIEFEAAKTLYFSEKYDKAIQAFNNYLKQYPTNALSFDAKYYLGEAYYRLNDRSNAAQYYQIVIGEQKSQFVNRAVARLADLELAAKNYNQAANYYNLMLARANSKKEQFNAWMGLMDTYFALAKYDSVGYFANEIVTKGNASLSAQNKALLYQGKVAYAQGNYDKAIDEFLKTLNTAQDEYGAEAQYLIGEAFFKKQQYKQSLDALFEVNKNFAAFEKWRGKAFLLMVDNYVALGEAHQAKATLKSIIENSPDQQIVAEAKTKLQTLESQKPTAAETQKEEEEEEDFGNDNTDTIPEEDGL